MPSLTCNSQATRLIPDVSVFRYRGLEMSQNFMHASHLITFFALSYRPWYILFHVQSVFTDVKFSQWFAYFCSHWLKTYLGNLVHPNMTAVPFLSLVIACLLVLELFLSLGLHLVLKLSHQRWECWYT